jgi:hypothetical protein
MGDNISMVDKIRATAAHVIQVARESFGQEVNYDEAGVQWLHDQIQLQYLCDKPSRHEVLVNLFGSFLGECIIHCFGGSGLRSRETGVFAWTAVPRSHSSRSQIS